LRLPPLGIKNLKIFEGINIMSKRVMAATQDPGERIESEKFTF
jgi:hypothetical protein